MTDPDGFTDRYPPQVEVFMTRKMRSRYLPLILAATILAAPTPAFADSGVAPAPIGPNQAFFGQVNYETGTATIKTVCPGPATAGRYGHPLGGQTVTVQPLTDPTVVRPGYTGSAATSINVLLNPSASAAGPIVLRFWGVSAAIPTTLTLPCDGVGSAQFVPTPGSPTARGVTVTVRFVNVAW
jgi:hypothetical protein